MEKYEILTELLSRFYVGDYKKIKHSTTEQTDSYRVFFGDDISLTVNTMADCVYLNIGYKDADALAFLNDVSKRHLEDKRKDKYEKAMEKLRLAQEEVSKLEKELEEECA